MKLQYITGCVQNDLYVDYASADMLPIEKLQDICKALIDRTTDKNVLQQIIIDYIYQLDRSELSNYDLHNCETCNSHIETYELEV